MTRVRDLQSPAQVVADVRRRLEANADEIEAVIAGAEREQRSDLSRREQARYDELRWGDVDERESRWRVSRSTAKTRKGRWVPVSPVVLQTVLDMAAREDRDLDAQVLAGFDSDAFRTALGRACRASGTPAFSPHDLRHRRASLWHLSGVPVAEAAGWLGHSPQEHLKTYAHVVLDRSEVDYESLMDARAVLPPLLSRTEETPLFAAMS